MHNDSGVTLLEIVTVISIVGIMSAIAIPNMISWLPDYKLKSAARELQSTMQFARFRAIKENANVVVSFNVGTDSYVVFVDDGAGDETIANDKILNGNEKIIRNGGMPKGIDMYWAFFWAGGSKTVLNSLGLSDTNGTVLIKNNQNGYRGVTLNRAGHSRIRKSTDGINWD